MPRPNANLTYQTLLKISLFYYNDIMAKHITRYVVFLDSNALRDREWIKTNLFSRLEDLRKERLAEVKFYVPAIVQDEWLNHYYTLASQHQSSIERFGKKLNEMGCGNLISPSLTDEEIYSTGVSQLRRNKIYTIPTPYDEIDW